MRKSERMNQCALRIKYRLTFLIHGSGCDYQQSANLLMGSTFKLLWFSEQIIDKYFLHFIDLNKEILKNSKKGAAIPHLNKELFFNLFLPIPP